MKGCLKRSSDGAKVVATRDLAPGYLKNLRSSPVNAEKQDNGHNAILSWNVEEGCLDVVVGQKQYSLEMHQVKTLFR